jgi:hypothetical protein
MTLKEVIPSTVPVTTLLAVAQGVSSAKQLRAAHRAAWRVAMIATNDEFKLRASAARVKRMGRARNIFCSKPFDFILRLRPVVFQSTSIAESSA